MVLADPTAFDVAYEHVSDSSGSSRESIEDLWCKESISHFFFKRLQKASSPKLSLIIYSKFLKDPLGDRLRSDGGYSLTSIESDFESPEIV